MDGCGDSVSDSHGGSSSSSRGSGSGSSSGGCSGNEADRDGSLCGTVDIHNGHATVVQSINRGSFCTFQGNEHQANNGSDNGKCSPKKDVAGGDVQELLQPSKGSLLQALRTGKSGMKNASSKFNLAISALKWRQQYLGEDWYVLPLESGFQLRVKQLDNGELRGIGTGAVVWPAACVLSKYIELRYGNPLTANQTRDSTGRRGMQGLHVCDIGSGTGVLGLVCACLGATATLTDQECVYFLMQENRDACVGELRAFHSEPETTCATVDERIILSLYDWGESPPQHLIDTPQDIIIVSDCVLPKLYPIEPLIQVVLLPLALTV
jgi:hypothetical protein